tara:strand:- start:3485 stop:3952 length:468 start_codon:yes stop_codon:yes gene_type:complete
MNSTLKNDFYRIPDELLDILIKNLKSSGSEVSGYGRLKTLCSNKGVNYGQAKKIKHEMEGDMDPSVFKLVGGDEMITWLNDKLGRERDIVDTTKRRKMDAGLKNQFKKTHNKDKNKNPTKVNLAGTQKTSDEIFNNRVVYEQVSRIREIIKKIII